jgi:hypothetical protein
MPEILQWPADFPDAKSGTDFDIDLLPLFHEMSASVIGVYGVRGGALFGFRKGSRCIEFIRRGRSRTLQGVAHFNRETYWEVLPITDGVLQRLGPLFEIRDYACVVICGVSDIRSLTMRWFSGTELVDAQTGITFWDRVNPSSPLDAMA